jgi:hypothetical protein
MFKTPPWATKNIDRFLNNVVKHHSGSDWPQDMSFLYDEHLVPQSYLLAQRHPGSGEPLRFDFIGDYAHFDRDMQRLREKLRWWGVPKRILEQAFRAVNSSQKSYESGREKKAVVARILSENVGDELVRTLCALEWTVLGCLRLPLPGPCNRSTAYWEVLANKRGHVY